MRICQKKGCMKQKNEKNLIKIEWFRTKKNYICDWFFKIART